MVGIHDLRTASFGVDSKSNLNSPLSTEKVSLLTSKLFDLQRD